MKIVTIPPAIADEVAQARRKGAHVGLIPTMGALHDGHLGLIERARKTCDVVICSIFVNPLQFNDPEDLERYPQRPVEDKLLLEDAGCDMLFLPEKNDIFFDFQPYTYDLGGLDRYWEGPSRPGHFQGVVNVVERLFFYTRPDEAFFGEKDRQQLTILQHVARAQHWPEQIISCPTTRETSGLAMSSRNTRLGPDQRKKAAIIYHALRSAASRAFTSPIPEIIASVQAILSQEPEVQLDHFGVADTVSLEPLKDWGERSTAVAFIAAQVGPVRLIDNILLVRG